MLTQVKVRNSAVTLVPQKVSSRPFGLSYLEMFAVVITLLTFVGVLVYYFSTLRHDQEDLKSLRRQVDALVKTEADLKEKAAQGKKVQEDVAKNALESLENFKSVYLKNLSRGRIALIDAINGVAKKDGVRLMSGIAMTADKVELGVDDNKKSSRKKNVDSLTNIFPSLKINFTVAGDYKNLREFIKDIEANKQFVTINSVTLTSIKEREGGGRSSGRRTAQVLSGISLAIDMTAYFQS